MPSSAPEGAAEEPRPTPGRTPQAAPVEVPLHGGFSNHGLVVRVGDTVHRPTRPHAPATHALLRHLEEVGFAGSPRFLGLDEQRREMLTFIKGEAVTRPYPPWAMTDSALCSVADLLRGYHDAVASFDPDRHVWGPLVPQAFRTGLVSHNDPNLDNVVFRDGEAVALIDFDLAGPGSAVWDVAAAARLWAPLRLDEDIEDERVGRALVRFRMFVDAYGLTGTDRSTVVDAVRSNHDWCYDIIRAQVVEAHPAFTAYWDGGGAARAARTEQWYAVQDVLLRAALQ